MSVKSAETMQSKVSGNFARKKGGWFDARMFFPRVPSSFGAMARHVIGSQRLNDFVSVLDRVSRDVGDNPEHGSAFG